LLSLGKEVARMNKETFSRLAKTLGFRILLLFLILYTVYHCVAAFSDRVVTDVVTNGIDRITVRGEAVLVRDEQVLTVGGGQHVVSYPCADGAKVNVTTPLAELYLMGGDTQTLQEMQAKLSVLDRQIALCEKLPLSDMLSSLPALQQAAREQLMENNRLSSSGAPLHSLDTGSFDLLLLLNRIAALTGESPSASVLIATLKAERQVLLSSAHGQTVTLQNISSASTGGYFFYADTVDGYEDILSRAALADMTAEKWAQLRSQPPRTFGNGVTVVGKLADSFRWSIVLPVSVDVAERLEEGNAYPVIFSHQQGLTLPMTLERIIPAENQALLVLTAEVMPEGFSYPRFSQVELIIEETQGYRVPETALVEADGRTGVYILERGRITWRDIRILSHGEGYVLVYAPTQAEREDGEDDTYHYDNYLALRDVVITEGDDLYDGKYIK
jgi:putative membrane fusion protein